MKYIFLLCYEDMYTHGQFPNPTIYGLENRK